MSKDVELSAGTNADPNRRKFGRLEDDILDPFGRPAYGLPIGTSQEARGNELDAATANVDDLLPGEKIISQYDVYYQGEVMPTWLFWVYTILTFGLYWVRYTCKNYCISKGCCLPGDINFTRGKLAITDKGRILSWDAIYLQEDVKTDGGGCLCCLFRPFFPYGCFWRLLCGKVCMPPFQFKGYTATGQYRVADVAEIVYDTRKKGSYLLGCGDCAEAFEGSIRVYFKRFDVLNQSPSTLKCAGSSTFKEYLTVHTVKLSESLFDIEHDNSGKTYTELAAIYNDISNAVIGARKGATWVDPKTAGLEKAESVLAPWGSLDTVTESKISIPAPWVSISPSETIIAVTNNMYALTCMDKVWTLLTLGYYYCKTLSQKRANRPSIILTSHRVLEITPWVADGCVTMFPCFACLYYLFFPETRGMTIRSLFPKDILGGSIKRYSAKHVSCTVSSDAGTITIDFDGLLAGLMDGFGIVSTLKFCNCFFSTATRHLAFPAESNEAIELNADEKDIFVMQQGEVPLARFSGKVADDVCNKAFPFGCPGLCTKERSYHPGVCMCATCGMLPSQLTGSLVLTNGSIFTLNRKGNSPWFCPLLCGQDLWELLWIPITSLSGMKVETIFVGDDNLLTRCFKGTFCGENCCPLMQSVGQVSVITSYSDAGVSEIKPSVGTIDTFKSLRMSPEIKAFRQALALIESRLNQAGSKTGQPVAR